MTLSRLAATAPLLLAFSGAPAATAYADVAGIFERRCIVCHRGASAPNGLQLDRHEAILAGSRRGPVVVPGSAAGSELVKRIRGERLPRMPLTGPPFLDDAEVAAIEAWIDAGAAPGAAPADAAAARAPAAPDAPGGPVDYRQVEPILLARCVKCHVESGGQMGPPPEGYVLRTHAQALATGERVRVVPGNPGASELLRRVRGLAVPRMPFDGPPWLSDGEIGLIERWIADGARDRDGKPAPVPVGAAVRLRGTLTAPGEVDGMPFSAAGVRVDRAPRVGGAVELRGVVEADGSVRAQRLRAR